MSTGLVEPKAAEAQDVELEFQRLADWWKNETAHLSNHNKAYTHPAYREIVALGTPVIPVLLRQLETKPGWWLRALRELTNSDPVSPDDRGDLVKMAASWVEWGRNQGMI